MAIECYPLVGSPIATELQWSRMARMYAADGVEGGPANTTLKVTAGTGLNVNIAAGQGLVRGIFFRSTTATTEGTTANGVGNPRIDRLVVRVNTSTHTGDFVFITGTPASNPVPPAETYTDTTFDLPLADVRVEASSSTITTITDRRPFLAERGLAQCTSTNRPNTRGRAAIVQETDTGRVIFTTGDGTWDVGMGSDLYAPRTIQSQSRGFITATSYTSDAGSLTDQVLQLDFRTGPSGRVLLGIGASITRRFSDTFVTLNVSGTGGTPHVTNDELALYCTATNLAIGGQIYPLEIGAHMFRQREFLLPANGNYVATMRYRLAAAGTASEVDDRYICAQALPAYS